MFTQRQMLFLASAALTIFVIERLVRVLIQDPERALFATFMIALALATVSWVAFIVRSYAERLERIARQCAEHQDAANLMAVVSPLRGKRPADHN